MLAAGDSLERGLFVLLLLPACTIQSIDKVVSTEQQQQRREKSAEHKKKVF
jgi:hypothetical protein